MQDHCIELRNYVDIDEVNRLSQLANDPEAEIYYEPGQVARRMFGWNFEPFVGQSDYIQSNGSLPPKWKTFPQNRHLGNVHKDGMYNGVRLSIMHNTNLTSLFILERAVETAILKSGMEVKRKDTLLSLTQQILQPLRSFKTRRNRGPTLRKHRVRK